MALANALTGEEEMAWSKLSGVGSSRHFVFRNKLRTRRMWESPRGFEALGRRIARLSKSLHRTRDAKADHAMLYSL